jgi:hypothetical protein
MAIVVLLLTLRGSVPAQTPTLTPPPSAVPYQVDRLKVAVQLEREQNDPILMTVVYAAQYAAEARALATCIRQRIGLRPQTDSGVLQAEDRER